MVAPTVKRVRAAVEALKSKADDLSVEEASALNRIDRMTNGELADAIVRGAFDSVEEKSN